MAKTGASMKKPIVWAKVKGAFSAVHKWGRAPQEVYHLRYPHRHLFCVTIWIEQHHNDRDIEYYMFRDWLVHILSSMDKPISFSCEQYAERLAQFISQQYGKRKLKIEVTEDGRNGALYETG